MTKQTSNTRSPREQNVWIIIQRMLFNHSELAINIKVTMQSYEHEIATGDILLMAV